ncbi:MAG: TolC family protein [Pseudomonadota bacterium]
MPHSDALKGWLLAISLLAHCSTVTGDDFRGSGAHRAPPTLKQAVESAYNRHPRVQTLDAQQEEAMALQSRADSLIAGNPSLEVSYKTDQIGSANGFRDWEAGIAAPLWKPGQRDAAQNVALSASQALTHSQRALRLVIAGEVRERMWQAALMQNNLQLANKEWDTAQTLKHSVKRRVELGGLAKTDLLLARDATLTKRADHAKAQLEFENARLSYASFTGLQRLPRRRGEQRTALTTINEDYPQLAEVAGELKRAKAELSAVRRQGAGNPELFLGGSGERADSNEAFNNRLGVSLSMPFGLEAHNRPVLAAAKRKIVQLKAEYENLLRKIKLAFVQAKQELEFAQAELELAREQKQLSLENLRLAKIAFEAGETDLVGLLRVQGLAFSAERRETQLHIIRQRSVARYNQALGVLP